MKLSPFRRGFLLGVTAAVVLTSALLLAGAVFERIIDPGGAPLSRAFKKLRPGMTRTEVLAIMPAGGEAAKEFSFWHPEEYFWEHSAARRVQAADFIRWQSRVVVVSVAFDAEGRAIYAVRGGT
jgi:hypothetical protein